MAMARGSVGPISSTAVYARGGRSVSHSRRSSTTASTARPISPATASAVSRARRMGLTTSTSTSSPLSQVPSRRACSTPSGASGGWWTPETGRPWRTSRSSVMVPLGAGGRRVRGSAGDRAVALPVGAAQGALVELAHDVARQDVDDLVGLGALVGGQVLPAPGRQLGRVGGGAGRDDECLQRLAQVAVGDPDDGDVGHLRV